MKKFIISGPAKEVLLIIEKLAERYPNMTIEEYMNKYEQDTMVLV